MSKKVTTEHEVDSSLNKYEVMLILNPDLREPEVKKKLKEIEEMVQKAGGKITQEDFWGKKFLAFRIKGQTEGVYMVYNFELPSNFLHELKEHMRIEKDILRSMIIKVPANFTYTKYDADTTPEDKPKKAREFYKKNMNVSVKHNSTVTPAKKKEETSEKKHEASADKEKDLDKKLNDILGGGDLKL